ncbi:MAG: hypothetical protein KDC34_18990 [Saprospiraceae bacterium]|nr:hypothetical protein [Saprospiraceae bacterium]
MKRKELLFYLDRMYDAYRDLIDGSHSSGSLEVHYGYRRIQSVLRRSINKNSLSPKALKEKLDLLYDAYRDKVDSVALKSDHEVHIAYREIGRKLEW